MKWTYIIAQKFKAALTMFTVFLLVFATNMMDKQHFSRLQESFTSVYEDRLVAENYLFDLSKYLQQKKQLLHEFDEYQSTTSLGITDSIDMIVKKYGATKLTPDEAQYFSSLNHRLQELEDMEKSLIHTDSTKFAILSNQTKDQFQFIWSDMEALSKIQLIEGQRLIKESQQIIASSNFTSRLEIVVLIVIGLIIQALIFSSKSLMPKFDQQSNLN